MVPRSLLSPETVLRGAIKTVSKVGLVEGFVPPLYLTEVCVCTLQAPIPADEVK